MLPFQISPQDGNAGLRAVGKAITQAGTAYLGKLLYSKLLLNLHSSAGSLCRALNKGVVTDQLLAKGWNLGTRSLWICTLEQWELKCSCSTNSRSAFSTHQLRGTINVFCWPVLIQTMEQIRDNALTSISLCSYFVTFRAPWLFLLIFFSSAWDFSKESSLLLCSVWYLFKVACKQSIYIL